MNNIKSILSKVIKIIQVIKVTFDSCGIPYHYAILFSVAYYKLIILHCTAR